LAIERAWQNAKGADHDGDEALKRAIGRIPGSKKGPLAVAIEVDRSGHATAAIDYEMTKEQLLRVYAATCSELERRERHGRVRQSYANSWR